VAFVPDGIFVLRGRKGVKIDPFSSVKHGCSVEVARARGARCVGTTAAGHVMAGHVMAGHVMVGVYATACHRRYGWIEK